MKDDLSTLAEKITSHPTFLKLKNIVENNPYHDHEAVFNHLTKTYDIAKREIETPFISNSNTKQVFEEYVSKDISGMAKHDVMLLTALLHDVGKALNYKDGNTENPLLVTFPDGTTMCPGHEYRGSVLVETFLKEFDIQDMVINHISKVIRLHDAFSQWYVEPKLSWDPGKIINDIKARGENVHIELLFNVYVDCYDASPFQSSKKKIEELFNSPSLYQPREYFVK